VVARLRFVVPLAVSAIAPALALCLSTPSCSLAGLASGGASSASSSSTGGGGSSTSGTGGATSSGDGGGGAKPATCPEDMVEIDGSAFCIDKLEVTNEDYLHFLDDAGPPIVDNNDVCAWNDKLTPSVPPDASPPKVPVLGVNWCDARAYCHRVGKRLCGKIGGGPLLVADQDRSDDQWFMACSANDHATYPYGADLSYEACADCDPDAGCDVTTTPGPDAAVNVGTKSGCEGGVPGLYDMSGNAWEWQDSCDDAGLDGDARAPENDHCYKRGGGYDSPHLSDGGHLDYECLQCAVCANSKSNRKSRSADVGFRCCLDLSP
jgi:formylglycine-generating enzyme required for sulfatase activity